MTAIPICLHCYEVFDPRMIKLSDEYNLCPRLNCNCDIVWVDENMIPIIFELNKKGYTTTDCCSSHIWDIAKTDPLEKSDVGTCNVLYNSLYVMFDINVMPPTVANGFTIEVALCTDESDSGKNENNFQCSIRKSWNPEEIPAPPCHLDAQRYMFNNLNILLEWAMSLPRCKGEAFVIPEEEVALLNSEEDIRAFLERRNSSK